MNILPEILEKSKPLPSISNIEANTFKKDFLRKNQPVLLKGYANNWRAKENWSFDYFAALENNKRVVVEVGNIFQSDDSKFVDNTFGTYLERLKNDELEGTSDKTYLSLFSIFELFPELKEDVDFSIFTRNTLGNNVYGWIGPGGTVTGLHWDSADNMFAQLVGKKMFLIASPKFNNKVYPSKRYDREAGVSQVDFESFDEEKYPRFKDVEFYKVTLEPGDVLFIPGKWWHYVKSIEKSISVNNFGYSLYDKLFMLPVENFKAFLHRRGYYRKNDCTCHQIIDGVRVSKQFT
ncbi:MAG: cupin-like domain-containing protein [Flavobacteriaceae bacterium]